MISSIEVYWHLKLKPQSLSRSDVMTFFCAALSPGRDLSLRLFARKQFLGCTHESFQHRLGALFVCWFRSTESWSWFTPSSRRLIDLGSTTLSIRARAALRFRKVISWTRTFPTGLSFALHGAVKHFIRTAYETVIGRASAHRARRSPKWNLRQLITKTSLGHCFNSLWLLRLTVVGSVNVCLAVCKLSPAPCEASMRGNSMGGFENQFAASLQAAFSYELLVLFLPLFANFKQII